MFGAGWTTTRLASKLFTIEQLEPIRYRAAFELWSERGQINVTKFFQRALALRADKQGALANVQHVVGDSLQLDSFHKLREF